MTNDQIRMMKHPTWPFFIVRVWSFILASGFWLLVLLLIVGCSRSSPPPSSAKSPKIASLVPAATDLIVGMNAADHLVAVSNWDTNRPEIAGLPRVGDYQTTDWEKLAQLQP